MEWVTMRHPRIADEATASREAFDRLYQPKGWEEVTAEEQLVLEGSEGQPEQGETLEDLTKDALVALADRRGVDVDSSDRKAEIVEALRASTTTEQGG